MATPATQITGNRRGRGAKSKRATGAQGNNMKVPIQKTFFDLDSFAEVTLAKEFEYSPVDSVDAALAKLGNDAKRLLKIVNDGLKGEQAAIERTNPADWQVLDDDGKPSGEFSGTQADQKMVNALVLQLAKTVFGFDKNMTAEQKNAARASAVDMIRNTPMIRDGLKKSAALKGDEAPADGAEASA